MDKRMNEWVEDRTESSLNILFYNDSSVELNRTQLKIRCDYKALLTVIRLLNLIYKHSIIRT